MNLRMTNLDEDALSIMIDKIQEIVPQKNISKSRVLRAVGYLNHDKEMTEITMMLIKKWLNEIK
ncbi:hypothetical protein [Arsenophonus nasoniae]|uniref:Uncharacterized protein n=1 Tax=Arsenophonus nasoniae TaxID=638 RepID=A0A4P7L3H4_9GAMM|nr:hypothetical protein [Arsenophonus nasoniae]QBY46956.1 hypothetical protein ArsFIN_55670 [Arsenophonus nasoniae]